MVAIAMVALGDNANYSWESIRDHMAQQWPELNPTSDEPEKEGVLFLNIDGTMAFFSRMPAPIPWSELEGPCATSMLWPNAADELKQHKEHVIVSVMTEEKGVETSTLLTKLTASLLASCPEAMGVYWGDATLVISRDVFYDFATEVLPHGPPLHIWVDTRVGPNNQGRIAGFTHGMEALGHMEIEAPDTPESVGDLRERFFGLAMYLIENGPVINDGDTIGEDHNERIRVIYSDSQYGHENRVMRLEYSSSPQTKPWWKFW